MKNFTPFICSVLLMLLPGTSYAEKFVSGGIWYNTLTENTCETAPRTDEKFYTGEITIPESVEYQERQYTVVAIGEESFDMQCAQITSLTLPNTIKEIKRMAFSGGFVVDGSGFECFSIPASVTTIDKQAFVLNSLREFEVDPANPNYCSVDGVLFTKDKKTLLRYPNGNKRLIYDIPEGTTTISSYAFWSQGLYLKTVNFPSSVETIESAAFRYFIVFDQVNLNEGLKSIGSQAFAGCIYLKSMKLPSTLQNIFGDAFQGCNSLKSLSIDAAIPPAVNGKFNIMPSLYVPSNLRNTYLAADGWKSLPRIITSEKKEVAFTSGALENALSVIDLSQIGYLKLLGDINGTDVKYINSVFANPSFGISLDLSEASIKSGGEIYSQEMALKTKNNVVSSYMFNNLPGIASLKLPETATEIEKDGVYYCENLTSLALPSSLTTLANKSLSDLYNLSELTIAPSNQMFETLDNILYSKGKQVLLFSPINHTTFLGTVLPEGIKEITPNAFAMSNEHSVIFPNTLEKIGDDAFTSSQIMNLIIPASVTSIGNNVTSGCEYFEGYIVDEENQTYSSDEKDILYTKDGTELISAGMNVGDSFMIPSNVQRIKVNAFGSNMLQKLIFKTPVAVGENAFKECLLLETVESLVKEPFSIPDNAFNNETYQNATLMVETDAVEAYKAANGWKNFSSVAGGASSIGAELNKDAEVYGIEHGIKVIVNAPSVVKVYAQDGSMLHTINMTEESKTIGVQSGFYIVNVNGISYKVIVK